MMYIRKNFLALLFLCFASLFSYGGGKNDLSNPQPGEGVVVVYTRATRGTQQKWILSTEFENVDTKETFSIKFSSSTKISLHKLPEGSYRVIGEKLYKDGSLSDIRDRRTPKFNFTVSAKEIKLWPYFIYYHDTKASSSDKARSLPLPEETNTWTVYGIQQPYPDGSIMTGFYRMNEEMEDTIYETLSQKEGFELWNYESPYRSLTPETGNSFLILCMGIDSFKNEPSLLLGSSTESARIIGEAMDGWAESNGYTSELINTADAMSSGAIEEFFDNINNESKIGKPLFVYISSHVINNLMGRPHILLEDSDIHRLDETALPLSRLMESMNSHEGEVMIILDIGRENITSLGRKTILTADRDFLAGLFDGLPENVRVLLPNGFVLDNPDSSDFANTFIGLLPELDQNGMGEEDYWMQGLSADYPGIVLF